MAAPSSPLRATVKRNNAAYRRERRGRPANALACIHPVGDPGFTPDRSQRLQGALKLKQIPETERGPLEKTHFFPFKWSFGAEEGNITSQEGPVGTEISPLVPKKEPFRRQKDPVVAKKTTLCKKI